MKRNLKSKKKSQVAYVLIGVFVLQAFILALIFSTTTNLVNVLNNNDNTDDEGTVLREDIIEADGIMPNLTRPDYPIVINNKSAEALWTALHGRHVNNLRIAYYSIDNEWEVVPFQLDEMGFFRSYKYEVGFQATVSFTSPNNVDLSNWIHYETDHRYAGKDIDAQPGDPYKEPTEFECTNGYWASRSAENYQDGDTPPDAPVQDPEELPGGTKEQLLRRLDYDDELCFYAKNGKQASLYSWWNYQEYPNRYRIRITDPVDGGQSWMYIYYNSVDMTNPPEYNHFVPSGETDVVSWDKLNSKITATTYELQIDSNMDLDQSLKIKWPGLASNNLYVDSNKQYLSVYFHILYDYGLGVLDVEGDTEIWREGIWDENPSGYNEQYTGIGYGLMVDLDILSLNGWNPAQDGVRDNHRTSGFGAQTHTINDQRKTALFSTQVTAGDAGDHDGDLSEIIPFVRGQITQSEINSLSNEAAIDGPCRVILDRMMVQFIAVDLGGVVDYEELWTISTKRSKYYSSLMQDDPSVLDVDLGGDMGDMQLDIHPHYAFMFGQRVSDFVRNDPTAYMSLGRAPNGVTGLPDFTQCATGTHGTWTSSNPLYLYPNGNGLDDDLASGGNPAQGDYTDNHLLPGSGAAYGSNPAATNPLSDWKYLYTSSGGAWSYVPYQEWWPLFTTEPNRDLATYWKDTGGGSGYSEWGLYGNDGNTNGATDEYIMRTVFGNFSTWECLREYARSKNLLSDMLTITSEVFPGGPIFEDTDIFINGVPVSGAPWIENGDVIWVDCDMDGDYDNTWSIIGGSTTLGYTGFGVTEIDSLTHVYRVELTVNDAGNQVPPSAGLNVRIQIDPGGQASYTDEEFYLDNTDPTAPTTLTPTQDGASVILTWSGESDNGEIDYYEIWRNSQLVKTLDAPASEWTDTDVLNGLTYTYFVRVYDLVGRSDDSSPAPITINMQFNPAQPADPTPYFNGQVTIDWTVQPGDAVIDNYRLHWAETSGGIYTPLTWLPNTQKTDNFDPSTDDPTPQNGTYYLKVESYDSAGGGVSILSGWVSSMYDTEDPFYATIVDIPDEYHPTVAEIPVQWSGAFDAFSGLDHYTLWRDDNGGGYVQINGDFDLGTTIHYDSNGLTNGHTYTYRVFAFDKAGNTAQSPDETVTYYDDLVGATPNLKIDYVDADDDSITRDGDATWGQFDVDVKVNNIGGLQGTVNTVELIFEHSVYGNVTHHFDVSGQNYWSGSQNIAAGGNYVFNTQFNNLRAEASCPEGLITIDAIITGSNVDFAADTVDTIYVRDFSTITIDSMSAGTIEIDSIGTINMTYHNDMVTQVNVSYYEFNLTGLVLNTDYTIESVSGPSYLPNGIILDENESVDLVFYVKIDSGVAANTYNVNGKALGVELISGRGVNAYATAAATLTVTAPNSPPDFFNEQVNPDPLPYGGTLNISATIIDPDGGGSVTTASAQIYDPVGTPIGGAITLYDDGAHGDNGNLDDLWANTWNSGTELGNSYYVTITAWDNVGSPNSTTVYFDITDQENPSVTIDSYDASVIYGSENQIVDVTVTDNVGLRASNPVQITYYRPDNSPIGTYVMIFQGGNAYRHTFGLGGEAPGDNYWFRILAYDTSNNLNNSETAYFNFVDDQDPSITIDSYDGSCDYGGQIAVAATITDNHQLNRPVYIYFYTSAHSLLGSFAMNNPGAGNAFDYTWNAGTNAPANGYYFNITAYDDYGNIRNETRTFNILDTEQPNIVIDYYNATVETGEGFLWVNVSVTDNYQLRPTNPVQITIYNPSSGVLVNLATMTYSGLDDYWYKWDATSYPSDSNYYFTVTATDNAPVPNVRTTAAQYFDIGDSEPPTAVVDTYDSWAEYGTGTIGVNVSVSDNIAMAPVSPVQISLYEPDFTFIGTYDMIYSADDDYWYVWNVGAYSSAANYYFTVTAYDNSTNSYTTSNNYFDINDTVNVSVSIDSFDATADYGTGTIDVSTTISDLLLETPVKIRFYNPDTSIIGTYSMANPSGDTWTYSWTVGTNIPDQNYYFRILANDTSNNLNNTEWEYFDIEDNQAPNIAGPGISPNPVPEGNLTEISATVTDNYQLRATTPVNCTIRYPNGTWVVDLTLVDQGSNYYNVSWDSAGYEIDNNYAITFNATDSEGNKQTITIYFNIILGSPPEITNPLINPTILEVDSNLTIICNASDSNGVITGVVAQIYMPGGSLITTVNMPQVGATTEYKGYWNSTGQTAAANYYVIINATDNDLISSWTTNLLFEITVTPPQILNPQLNTTSVEYTGDLNISATIIDANGVGSATAYLYYINGTQLATQPLSNVGGSVWAGIWDSGTTPPALFYYVIINATDSKGYENTTGYLVTMEFDIVDTTDPTVTVDNYNNVMEYQTGSIGVNVSILDNYGLRLTNPVQIRFYRPSTAFIGVFTMINSTGDDYWYVWIDPTEWPGDDYYFTVTATDQYFNSYTTGNNLFNITDSVNPSVSIDSYTNDTAYGTGSILVGATIQDNFMVDDAIIEFYDPLDSLIDTQQMNNPFGTYWEYTWSVGVNAPGDNYYFKIIANDTNNNINDTVVRYFNITDSILPTITVDFYNISVQWLTGSMHINATIADNHQLRTANPVNITIWYPNGTVIVSGQMINSAGANYWYKWLPGSIDVDALFYFAITAFDESDNSRTTINQYFNIEDWIDPQVTIDLADITAEYATGTISVNVSVTDNYQLNTTDPVVITFYEPDSSVIGTFTMIFSADDDFWYVWNVGSYGLGTNYYFNVTAYDVFLNSYTTSGSFFDIVDTQGPVIQNTTANSTAYNIGETALFTVDVMDVPSGVHNVSASVYNVSNNALIETKLMVYSGVGNGYTITFNTSAVNGYTNGQYYFYVLALDQNFLNSRILNTTLSLTFTLNERIGFEFDFANITVNIGYIGEDTIEIEFNFRNYDSEHGGGAQVADINITNIYVQFGDIGEYNSYFVYAGLNISAALLDALVLAGSADYTWLTIYYDIASTAPTAELIGDGGHIYIIVDYKDILFSNSYSENKTIEAFSGENDDISIYEVPKVTGVQMYITGSYLSGTNTVDFAVFGTHSGTTYRVYINLTGWGLTTIEITSNWDVDHYYYNHTNLPSGQYDGADINVIMNTTIAGFKENSSETFSGTFTVDSLDPILNAIFIPLTGDATGFWILFNITDDDSAGLAVMSDISHVTIQVSGTQPDAVAKLLTLSQSGTNPEIYQVFISSSVIDLKNFAFREGKEYIEYGPLTIYDNAGNTYLNNSLDEKTSIIDDTKPSIDLTAITFGDLAMNPTTNSLEVPAGVYLKLLIKISDGGDASSGIYYVRIYYSVNNGSTGGIGTSQATYKYITLAGIGNGSYFGILSPEGSVGFTSDQTVTFYLVVSDFAGNVYSTALTPMTLTFKAELPIVSYIVLFIAAASFIGAIVFRLGVYRKKAMIIDLDKIHKGKISKKQIKKKQ